MHCLGTLLWKWPICVSVCVYWVCLCVCTYGTRVCKLEHSVSTGIVWWHHVCLSERRGEGRRGSWFAWGRERLDCVYSLPALQADSSRDTAGRPRAAERQRQEGKREGRKREQERVGARKRERESERASGSTATRDLTPVTTLAMVNYYIDPFTSKATGGYTHTHTLAHFHKHHHWRTSHTNHCYTKQGQCATQTGCSPFSESKQRSSHLLWFSAGWPLCPLLVPPPWTPHQLQSLGGLIVLKSYCSREGDQARAAASYQDTTSPARFLKNRQEKKKSLSERSISFHKKQWDFVDMNKPPRSFRLLTL